MKDLFKTPEKLPSEIKAILDRFSDDALSYQELEEIKAEMENLGYTFDYGLSAEPTNLREIELTHYIFGSDAVQMLHEEGFDEMNRAYQSDEIVLGTFKFKEGITKSQELAEAMDGWGAYAIVSREEFNKL